jgi:hypothetical protein
MEASFDSQTLFPFVTHGDVKNPALVLLNDFSQNYNEEFINGLTNDYYVIVMEFPKMTQRISSENVRPVLGKEEALLPDSLSSCLSLPTADPRYGFTFLELMDSFYQTLTKLHLLDDIGEPNSEGKKTPTEVKEEVQERLRRLSVIDDFQEPEPLRTDPEDMSEVTSVDGSIDEKQEMEEEEAKEKQQQDRILPPSVNAPVKKSGLIPDKMIEKENLPGNITSPSRDLLERAASSRTLAANKATPPVNVFNVEAVKATNEEIQRKANSRRNSISSPTRISRQSSRRDSDVTGTKGGWKEEPEKGIEPECDRSPAETLMKDDENNNEYEEEADISPYILDHVIEKEEELKQIPTNRHLKAVVTQSYFASYFLFLYQKQFPTHISTIVCLQYGIKNVFYLSDIFTTFIYEWICCGFFLFSRFPVSFPAISLFSKSLAQILFFCFHVLLIIIAVLMEIIVFITYFPSMIYSSRLRKDGKLRLFRLTLWMKNMIWYNCSVDNCFLYYQLWRKRVSGHPSVYQLIFPDQCRLLFLVSLSFFLFMSLFLIAFMLSVFFIVASCSFASCLLLIFFFALLLRF